MWLPVNPDCSVSFWPLPGKSLRKHALPKPSSIRRPRSAFCNRASDRSFARANSGSKECFRKRGTWRFRCLCAGAPFDEDDRFSRLFNTAWCKERSQGKVLSCVPKCVRRLNGYGNTTDEGKLTTDFPCTRPNVSPSTTIPGSKSIHLIGFFPIYSHLFSTCSYRRVFRDTLTQMMCCRFGQLVFNVQRCSDRHYQDGCDRV